jgi:GH25 family lysozyme M1 (1,4-beta-N-acetylmuramidase)
MAYAEGEDRSSFQPAGPWAGNFFGFAKATEGANWIDPTFAPNWVNLGREGVVRGAYHFFHPAEDAVGQARFFVSVVNSHGGFHAGDIFVLDAEITVGADGLEEFGTETAELRMHAELRQALGPAATVGGGAGQFLAEVARLVGSQCPVVLYSNLSMAQADLGGCSGYPLWVADYSERPPASVAPWRSWTFWQNEGGGGRGGGDSDFFNGDQAALRAWLASYDWTEHLVANLPTLQQGSKDAPGKEFYVRRLQNDVAGYGRWNSLGAVTAIHDDGIFGATTKAAVEKVQSHAGLAVDGVVGRDTWTVLIG